MNELPLGPLCAFLSSLTWAAGSAAYAKVSRHQTPFAINFTRALIGLPLFLLLAVWLAGGVGAAFAQFAALESTQLGWFAVAMFGSYGFGDALFLWSVSRIGLPAALAIASSFPIWTALGGAIFQNETFSVVQFLGLLVSVSGIIVVILSGPKAPGERKSPRQQRIGVLLAFLASFFWALNAFSISHVGRTVPPGVGNTIRMCFALAFTFAMGRTLAPRSRLLIPWSAIKSYLWAFVLEGFVGSSLFLYGLSNSSLAVGSVLTSLAPVVSVPVAVVFGLERFSLVRTIGVAMVVMGIALLFV